MPQVRTAVIGVGYLGAFHGEKVAQLYDTQLIAVADRDYAVASQVAQRLGVEAVVDYRQLFERVDAVIIAVPTQSHYEIAKDCLAHGLHVLLEKPMASTVDEAQTLMDLSNQTHRILQIGHLERFNPAVIALEKVIEQPLFIESHRLAPYKPRGMDTNVVLDLMIHDIDIILHLVDAPVTGIDASGIPVLSEHMDIANARIRFANGCVANVTASRVSFKAERKMRLFQPDAYITVDFQNRKLAVHRKNQEPFDASTTPIVSTQQTFAAADPLQAEIAAFVAAIQHGTPPLVTGNDGKRALQMAIEITRQVTANRPTASTASQSGDVS